MQCAAPRRALLCALLPEILGAQNAGIADLAARIATRRRREPWLSAQQAYDDALVGGVG